MTIPRPGDWRHSRRVPLKAVPSAVPVARLTARLLLGKWGLGGLRGLCEDTELVVSELVTNALRATREAGLDDAPVVLWLYAGTASALAAVWDPVPLLPPPPGDAGDDAEDGRGLAIVAALAGLDCYPAAGAGGKFVRAVIGDPR